ncbi:MAG: hypothetical protein AB4042_05330 [Leptolyngbyaceae cyanobacterium]
MKKIVGIGLGVLLSLFLLVAPSWALEVVPGDRVPPRKRKSLCPRPNLSQSPLLPVIPVLIFCLRVGKNPGFS